MEIKNELIEKIKYFGQLHDDNKKASIANVLSNSFSNQITLTQLIYLDCIYNLGNPTFKEVAEDLKLAKPTITNTVNKLINDGYLNKIQSIDDRRVFHLHLTKMGIKAVEMLKHSELTQLDKIISSLDPAEIQQAILLIDKIISKLKEE